MNRKKSGSKVRTELKVISLRWPTESEVTYSVYVIKRSLNNSLWWLITLGIFASGAGYMGLAFGLIGIPLVLYIVVLAAERVPKLVQLVNGKPSKVEAPNAQEIEQHALEKKDFRRLILTGVVIVAVIIVLNI